MKDLKGKVSVITGGGTGIGLAIGLELAAAGDAKIVIASTNAERLEEGAAELRKAGATVLTVVCDVSSRSDVQALHDKAVDAFGPVDVLVCSSGVTTGGPFVEHRPEDWDWVFGVCLYGPAYCIQSFYPDMVKRQAGHIVLVGSQAGMNPTWFAHHGPYTCAKSGVMALGAALRLEALEHNVGVTSVIVAATTTSIMRCERSRPEKYGTPQPWEAEKREARRIPAADVGRMMVEGIRENKEWVATHPDLKQMQKEYFDRILAAYDH
ncbi:NAD(P)-binding domain protein [Niveomyces insectorum RCEF 264]|uniref:NAD(P)-binding domain protein n=1 Tax=Niveomyces insectorum RCEF 264 TaxID=1081102 RepID=A0A167Q8U9_9HYPO|nr:NAD(P)-binding domain protein [Niveomyces insectorum RCEF 264]